MREHLIFFDSECPFCHRTVAWIIGMDTDRHFLFAPLNGSTAQDILVGPQKPLARANSLILVENYLSTERVFWTCSQAIFRIYWLSGNGWGLVGILSYLPAQICNFFYRKFANHRHQFKLKIPQDPGPKERFLP